MNQALPDSDACRLLEQLLDSPSIEDISLPDHCLSLLNEAAHQHQQAWAAHMTPTLAPYSLLGLQLAGLHQGNLLSAELYPKLKQAEQTSLDWFKSGFHYPYASFTHGGSYNNLQALWQARTQHNGSRRIVYASRASHYSVARACDILGLDYHPIDTGMDDVLSLEALSKACVKHPPLAVVLNAGTSALGAMDQLDRAADIAGKAGAWTHIDASWGGAVMLLPENRQRFSGLADTDSLCFDPHKSLFQPRPCSVLMSRHPVGNTQETDYLAAAPTQRLGGSYGGELFLPLWLNLKLLGQDWFFQQTRARLKEADSFSHALATQTPWQVVNGGTGIVCFTSAGVDLQKLVISGTFSTARVNQQPVYRAVFAGWQTQSESLIRALHPYL